MPPPLFLPSQGRPHQSGMAMVVDRLCKSYGAACVLDNVKFTLRVGEVVLLVGANGSGKTTLINVLTGCLEPDSGVITLDDDRVIRFPSALAQMGFSPEAFARAGIGRTWQDLRLFASGSLEDNLVAAMQGLAGRHLCEALFHPRRVRDEERRARITCRSLLDRVGLAERAGSSADRISYGQAKRVVAARAIAAGARVLFLDEPLSGLDSQGITDVHEMLSEMVALGITLVIVEHEHNARHVLDLADWVWRLDRGRLEVRAARDCRIPAPSDSLQLPGALLAVLESLAAPRVLNLGDGAQLAIYSREPTTGENSALDVKDLCVVRGPRILFCPGRDSSASGLTFSLCAGDIAILSAPNGWGKTTLLQAIAGTIRCARGQVRVSARDVTSEPSWERRRLGVGMLALRDCMFPSLTVRDAMALGGCGPPTGALAHLADRQVGNLSGGERRRAAIESIVAQPNLSVLLLDEPFAALDTEGARWASKRILAPPRRAVLLAAPARGHVI